MSDDDKKLPGTPCISCPNPEYCAAHRFCGFKIGFEQPAQQPLPSAPSATAPSVLLYYWPRIRNALFYGTPENNSLLIEIDEAMRRAPRAEADAPKQQGFCLMAADGRMLWDEGCIASSEEALRHTLISVQGDEPDDDWRIVPFFASHHGPAKP